MSKIPLILSLILCSCGETPKDASYTTSTSASSTASTPSNGWTTAKIASYQNGIVANCTNPAGHPNYCITSANCMMDYLIAHYTYEYTSDKANFDAIIDKMGTDGSLTTCAKLGLK